MQDAGERTKHEISAAMKRLVAERPLDQVRVVDIQRAAHISPRTFYYHFEDKFDLVVWTFWQDIRQIFEQAGIPFEMVPGPRSGSVPRLLPRADGGPCNPTYESYARYLVAHVSQHRDYYRHVFGSVASRNLRKYLEDVNYVALRCDLAAMLGDTTVSEYEMYTVTHYLADADVAALLRWVAGDESGAIIEHRGFEIVSPLTALFLQFSANYLNARHAEVNSAN